MTPDDVNLGLHIAAGSVALILGPITLLMPKRRPRHPHAGDVYHWTFLVVAATAALAALLDWEESWFFLPIALFSYAFALVGFLAAKRRPRRWLIPHVIGMGGSYIALVSGFVTVNWETFGGDPDSILPFFLPSVIGFPIVAFVVVQVVRGKRPKRRRISRAQPADPG